MSAQEFLAYYWLMADLVAFARRLGMPTHGNKPQLSERIRRHLSGHAVRATRRVNAPKRRDSDARLTRATLVVNYFSDDKTRAFFTSQIGSRFHFTYHLNQWRLARKRVTYGDLVDEWLAEERRRKDPDYEAPLADHGRYNRFIRDYFADGRNKGKSMVDAAKAWNAVKFRRGGARYRRTSKRA